MIVFHFESDFIIKDQLKYIDWIGRLIDSEAFSLGQIDYIFCSDEYLLRINQEYLNHDTYTDIITFDYVDGTVLSGDIFISEERVRENAVKFEADFDDELRRVMSHGILHLMGYKDKEESDALIMRNKELEKMKMFHVEP